MTLVNFPLRARHVYAGSIGAAQDFPRAIAKPFASRNLGVGGNVRPRGLEPHATFLDRRLRMGIAEEVTSGFDVFRKASDEVIRKIRPTALSNSSKKRSAADSLRCKYQSVLSQYLAPRLHETRPSYLPCVSLDEIRLRTSSHGIAFALPESNS